ncbi:Transcription elongation factor SPT6-like [Senna tora]|uniref:Transcription elongation factor SPT6-like n=1 Tax=Senna tora TaxID=362788 RepID=A0A834WK39_9FABA|nr:Transcription elongation factor SPT6-like [Senna tora]
MYRKEQCLSLLKDPDQDESESFYSNDTERKPQFKWHKAAVEISSEMSFEEICVKWQQDKPVMKFKDAQWLIIHKAEEEKLLEAVAQWVLAQWVLALQERAPLLDIALIQCSYLSLLYVQNHSGPFSSALQNHSVAEWFCSSENHSVMQNQFCTAALQNYAEPNGSALRTEY